MDHPVRYPANTIRALIDSGLLTKHSVCANLDLHNDEASYLRFAEALGPGLSAVWLLDAALMNGLARVSEHLWEGRLSDDGHCPTRDRAIYRSLDLGVRARGNLADPWSARIEELRQSSRWSAEMEYEVDLMESADEDEA